ncbi:hypothetical protein [Acanthopleuribacter pedis]|uniref:Transmembrane protein n=1 Tax=Acanthopleuribacter pedis TaxID=442870 RepID=A0A8J7Q8S4_9BACT|nr:hypothetical protein [Acanthopleuribacter pedis]MBO1319524.1 hypothetical protein [Acanthopleuribacter pedis]
MHNDWLTIYLLVSVCQKAWFFTPGYIHFDGHRFLVPDQPTGSRPDRRPSVWVVLAVGLTLAHLGILWFVGRQPGVHPIQPLSTALWVNFIGGGLLFALVPWRHRALLRQNHEQLADMVGALNPRLEVSFPPSLFAPLIFNAALLLIAAFTVLPDRIPLSIDPNGAITWGAPTWQHMLISITALTLTWGFLLLLFRSKRQTLTVTHLCSVPATLHLLHSFLVCIALLSLSAYSDLQTSIPFIATMATLFLAFVFELPLLVWGFLTQICLSKTTLNQYNLIAAISPEDVLAGTYNKSSDPLSFVTRFGRGESANFHHPHFKWLLLLGTLSLVFLSQMFG